MTEASYKTGKICYIEIPADDVAGSAAFYQKAFGWNIRARGDGATSFDDTVGQVSGTWVTGLPPSDEPGIIVYIMVANADSASGAVIAAGGSIEKPVDPASPEVFFTFKDPAGNVMGVYQQPGLAASETQT